MESILRSTRVAVGVAIDDASFDDDIIPIINTVFMDLTQRLGVGPSEGFIIEDDSSEWSDFIPNNLLVFEGVKTYMGQRVKRIFDPPTNAAVLDSLERQINQFESTLNMIAENLKS
jgi:hypothetical protein